MTWPRSRRISRHVCAISLALASGIMASGAARASCIKQSERETFFPAVQAIAVWQTRRSTDLSPDARDALLDIYCRAAKDVASDIGIDLATIATRAGSPLGKYLDASIGPGGEVPRMSRLVAADFSFNAMPSLPDAKALGMLVITYTRAVDSLQVRGRAVRPAVQLVVLVGQVPIVGTRSGIAVCRGSVAVVGFQSASFRC